jgi:hypothetical protein
MGYVMAKIGDYAGAGRMYRRALDIYRRTDASPMLIAASLTTLGGMH